MKARSVASNLVADTYVGNVRLQDRVRDREFCPRDLARMTADHVHPERWRQVVEAKVRRDEYLSNAKPAATTDQFRCSRCKHRECSYMELQTRSCDEPASLFICCLRCMFRVRTPPHDTRQMPPRKSANAAAAANAAANAAATGNPPIAVAEVNALPSDTETDDVLPPSGSTATSVMEKVVHALSVVKGLANELKEVQVLLKVLQKEVKRGGGRRVFNSGVPRKPSGFAVPTSLSEEMCDFLGVDKTTQMARKDVTRQITQYVKDKGLYDESDKRVILPDARLTQLLSVSNGDRVTYFNLQTHIKQHFVRAAPAPATATATATAPATAAA
ncbi:hypothetical protein CEUSTIGMA_g11955.t1 [Chlamydomonas eustigma]|uniref:Uncharacterized protein n=1 Tax=Chlamydomonas eustigma TaxID=1157962 RepID=A0A250XN68_9CHLO|nr:hypothetical protein CEUSTIGMA_g11955.t1 [Chlamydomonas eustigma]|eukprot:GAX84534.1 hypothetical protein CEUSTIGMA_g11955.t1 [Chlamydomonas eustigma]